MAIKKTKHIKKAARQIKKTSVKKAHLKAKTHKAVSKKPHKVLASKIKKITVKTVHVSRKSAKKLLAMKLEEQEKARKVEEGIRLTEMVASQSLIGGITTSVGTGAMDILKLLSSGPRTDEGLAESLNVKVNDVRRMLNAMNSYSIVRYDVNKDNKGWLIFTWRIDSEKLGEYIVNIEARASNTETVLPGNCNDFFVCKACYKNEKTVLPFDSAYEINFSCGGCGKPFSQLSREETVALFKV